MGSANLINFVCSKISHLELAQSKVRSRGIIFEIFSQVDVDNLVEFDKLLSFRFLKIFCRCTVYVLIYCICSDLLQMY